jgi:hypothetical protein
MTELFREIEVTCPVCKKVRSIRIPEQIIAQKRFGVVRIQVPQGGVCPDHQFIVFIDTKGIIRGYEKIDLLLKLAPEERISPGRFTLSDFIAIFGMYGVFCLIHAKLFNYPAYIIKNKEIEDVAELINKIGEAILPKKFQHISKVNFLDKTDYDTLIMKEKNAFLMDANQNILQVPWDEKLKFEEEMVKTALGIFDENDQLKLIQQTILNFIKQAEFVKDVLERTKQIYEDELANKVSRELLDNKVNLYRIALIKDFIRQRFSSRLADKIKNKVAEFLNLL